MINSPTITNCTSQNPIHGAIIIPSTERKASQAGECLMTFLAWSQGEGREVGLREERTMDGSRHNAIRGAGQNSVSKLRVFVNKWELEWGGRQYGRYWASLPYPSLFLSQWPRSFILPLRDRCAGQEEALHRGRKNSRRKMGGKRALSQKMGLDRRWKRERQMQG